MNAEMRDLYTETLLDHSRSKRNKREIPSPPAACTEGDNPLCGDRVTIFVHAADGVIQDASYTGVGCAISLASASMACDAVRGKPVEQARTITDALVGHLRGGKFDGSLLPAELAALSGVGEFPMRVKCATLAWRALRDALDAQPETVR